MDDRIRRLRTEAQQLARGKVPRAIRYPAAFRAAAVALAGPRGSAAARSPAWRATSACRSRAWVGGCVGRRLPAAAARPVGRHARARGGHPSAPRSCSSRRRASGSRASIATDSSPCSARWRDRLHPAGRRVGLRRAGGPAQGLRRPERAGDARASAGIRSPAIATCS